MILINRIGSSQQSSLVDDVERIQIYIKSLLIDLSTCESAALLPTIGTLLNNIFSFLSRFSRLHLSLKKEARLGVIAQYKKLSLA